MTFLDHFSHTTLETTPWTSRYKLTTCSFIRKYLFSGEEASGIIMTTRHESEEKQGEQVNRITIVANPQLHISHIKLKPSEMLADVRLKEADCEGSDPAGISCLALAQAPAPEQWEIIGRN